jgi:excisionase family DNA binding protein
MVDSSVRFQPTTLPGAARILGVSESTVRRLVKAGKLEAERVLRPQGHVWVVMVPAPSEDPPTDPPRRIGASPANPPEQPAALPALTAWMTTVLEPLVAELGTSRQRCENPARENGRQAAELERAASIAVKLSDELNAARAQISTLVASTAAHPGEATPGEPPGSRQRALAPWRWLVLVLVVAVTTMTVLLAWPRWEGASWSAGGCDRVIGLAMMGGPVVIRTTGCQR